jgi:hypothetical protein
MKVEIVGVQGVATSQRDLGMSGAEERTLSHAKCLHTNRLDEVARRVNEVCRSATFDLAFTIGQLIIHELYGGSICEWRRHGTARPSYRALAARKDLLLSPSALCRSVGVYVLAERLGGRQRWKHLCVSHLKEVLPLPECEQDRILEVAEREAWTVSELRERLSLARGRTRDDRRSGTLLRGLRRVHSQLCDRVKALEATAACALKSAERTELEQLIDSLNEQLALLRRVARGDEQTAPRATE